jgi:hypothetical protein
MLSIIKLTHKTKPIVIVDLSNQKTAEIIKRTDEAQKEIATMAPKSALIVPTFQAQKSPTKQSTQ